MSANWAEDNLQTIRTLMERASVYRRALAPVSMAAGGMGLITAVVAEGAGWTTESHFAFYLVGGGVSYQSLGPEYAFRQNGDNYLMG